jgi:hypothetical protein
LTKSHIRACFTKWQAGREMIFAPVLVVVLAWPISFGAQYLQYCLKRANKVSWTRRKTPYKASFALNLKLQPCLETTLSREITTSRIESRQKKEGTKSSERGITSGETKSHPHEHNHHHFFLFGSSKDDCQHHIIILIECQHWEWAHLVETSVWYGSPTTWHFVVSVTIALAPFSMYKACLSPSLIIILLSWVVQAWSWCHHLLLLLPLLLR